MGAAMLTSSPQELTYFGGRNSGRLFLRKSGEQRREGRIRSFEVF